MKCLKCNGRGYVANSRYVSMSCAEAYEKDILTDRDMKTMILFLVCAVIAVIMFLNGGDGGKSGGNA